MDERRFLEKSLSLSVRVDARDLAVVARWMARDGEMGLSRSSVVATALKSIAAGLVRGGEPDISSLQEAYSELDRLGMAPRGAQASMRLVRAMTVEQAAWGGDSQSAGNIIKKHLAGTGKGREELMAATSRELGRLSEDKMMNDVVERAGITPAQADILRTKLSEMKQNGAGGEELARMSDVLISRFEMINKAETKQKEVRQAETIRRGEEHVRALNASSPGFEEDYKAREEEKLRELKNGLKAIPAVKGGDHG